MVQLIFKILCHPNLNFLLINFFSIFIHCMKNIHCRLIFILTNILFYIHYLEFQFFHFHIFKKQINVKYQILLLNFLFLNLLIIFLILIIIYFNLFLIFTYMIIIIIHLSSIILILFLIIIIKLFCIFLFLIYILY